MDSDVFHFGWLEIIAARHKKSAFFNKFPEDKWIISSAFES